MAAVKYERISVDFCTENKSGYCFCLANGQKWLFTTTEELRTWAEKLATAMQLAMCEPDDYARMVFIRGQSEEYHGGESALCLTENAGKALSTGDWEYQDIGDIRFWWKTGAADVICQVGRGNENLDFTIMRDSLYPIYQEAQESGGLALHAGLIERGEKGVLLAGAACTGKSTCCRRIPKPWHVLCDEECLVVQGGQKEYLVHPFPTWSYYLWRCSEQTWNIQRHVFLKAIFFAAIKNTFKRNLSR